MLCDYFGVFRSLRSYYTVVVSNYQTTLVHFGQPFWCSKTTLLYVKLSSGCIENVTFDRHFLYRLFHQFYIQFSVYQLLMDVQINQEFVCKKSEYGSIISQEQTYCEGTVSSIKP